MRLDDTKDNAILHRGTCVGRSGCSRHSADGGEEFSGGVPDDLTPYNYELYGICPSCGGWVKKEGDVLPGDRERGRDLCDAESILEPLRDAKPVLGSYSDTEEVSKEKYEKFFSPSPPEAVGDAVEAIRAAMRIEHLWIPAVASIEHADEVQALHRMRQKFIDVLYSSPNTEKGSE